MTKIKIDQDLEKTGGATTTPIADLIDASTFETLHLSKSKANHDRLLSAIAQLNAGISYQHAIIEV